MSVDLHMSVTVQCLCYNYDGRNMLTTRRHTHNLLGRGNKSYTDFCAGPILCFICCISFYSVVCPRIVLKCFVCFEAVFKLLVRTFPCRSRSLILLWKLSVFSCGTLKSLRYCCILLRLRWQLTDSKVKRGQHSISKLIETIFGGRLALPLSTVVFCFSSWRHTESHLL